MTFPGQGALHTCLNLARQAVSGAHTLAGAYTKPCTKSKNILTYSTEWRGKKPLTNSMLFMYRLKNAAFEEPVCSNSVEVTEQIGILRCEFERIRKTEITVR